MNLVQWIYLESFTVEYAEKILADMFICLRQVFTKK